MRWLLLDADVINVCGRDDESFDDERIMLFYAFLAGSFWLYFCNTRDLNDGRRFLDTTTLIKEVATKFRAALSYRHSVAVRIPTHGPEI